MKLKIVREGPVKITKSKIEAVWRSRAQHQRLVLTDLECRGLALVVNPSSMSWRFEYKPRGKDPVTGKRFHTNSITIGSPETHSTDEARLAANQHKGQAKAGADLAAERKSTIKEQAKKRGRTMGRVLEAYSLALPHRPKLRSHGKLSPNQIKYELLHARAAIASINAEDKPASDIGDEELKDILRATSDKPATAWHRYGALSRLFDWAQDEKLTKINPCLLLAKKHRPRSVPARSTYQTPQQIAELWKAVSEVQGLQQVHRDLMQFLVVIPCRRGEAAGMDWRNVDLTNATWTQAGHITKNGDPHRLYLHPLALEILVRRNIAENKPQKGLVFPAPLSGKPINTFGDIKDAICKAFPNFIDWRNHDNRRSFVTALGEVGVHEALLDSMLNHRQSATRGGVLGVYQRAQRWPEQVNAMKLWGNIISAAIKGAGSSPDKVIQMNAVRHEKKA